MIRIENLSKSFGEKNLLQEINFHFTEGGKISLIGENGAGKSTLLNIIIGIDTPDEGQILVPQNCTLAFLPQEPNQNPKSTILAECKAGAEHIRILEEQMEKSLKDLEVSTCEENIHAYEAAESSFRSAGGYSLDSKAISILSGLGFVEKVLEKDPRELSGGWRMRLELGKIFLRDPDFLILDEPTNHLDLPSLVWVENYLKSFRGTLLFVSHDKTLLNKLSEETLYLNNGKIDSYRGNFDKFVESHSLREQQNLARKQGLQKNRDELEKFVLRFGAKASKAKQAQSKMKMISKLDEQAAQIEVAAKESNLRFNLPEPEKSDRIVYQVTKGDIGYSEPLSSNVDLQIEKGQKIAVIGANGIGKSTLLRTVSGLLPSLKGDFTASPRCLISYFAQDQLETLEPDLSIIDNILAKTELGEKEVRSLLGGFLFSGDDVYKKVKVLSGGEKSRVGLACVLAQKQNFLLLDEPTNHLDMKSADGLTKAIQAYQGTVLFVSHDRQLINKVSTHIFAMLPDGRSMLFEGDLNDYVRLAALAGFPNVLEINQEPTKKDDKSSSKDLNKKEWSEGDYKNLKRQRNKLEKSIQEAEKKIQKFNKAIEKIEGKMATIKSDDYQKMEEDAKEHNALKEKLAKVELQWIKASGDLEEVESSIKASGRE